MTIVIWGCALILYLLFKLWYDGRGKPLTSAEIERFIHILEQHAEDGHDTQSLAVVRKFMEADDGKEFIMANVLQLNVSPVKHPDSGQDVSASELLQAYFKPLMKTLLRRAGHPVLTLRVVGGYIDAWNTPPNPGWHAVGLVRYRSRRDAMQASLAASSFHGIHAYKVAALAQTFAMPTHTTMSFHPSPRITVALVLALAAALLQLGVS